jgi:hypothetical protein
MLNLQDDAFVAAGEFVLLTLTPGSVSRPGFGDGELTSVTSLCAARKLESDHPGGATSSSRAS